MEQVPFTLVDFAACDQRYARHFARIPREHWNDETVSVDEWLSLDAAEADGTRPARPRRRRERPLQRLIVDARLMQAARRCRELWHGLQELGLARLRAETAPVGEAPTEAVEESVAEPPEEAVAEERAPDEPWIETPRCSTCNECTAINDRMFAYNDNKQAYIKDPTSARSASSSRRRKSCQVAIIHPGKPRNPNEPGLDELIERAKAFQ